MTLEEQDIIRDAVLWLHEHAMYVDDQVSEGYQGIQDSLASLLSADPRPKEERE